MWTKGLVARLHGRTPSGAPLLSSKAARPYSTASLAPILERQQRASGEPSCDVPRPSDAPTTIHGTVDNTAVSRPAPDAHGGDRSPTDDDRRDIESNEPSRMKSVRAFLTEEIDTTQAAAPLTAYCFMTGFIDSVSFSAMFVWCAFQTGNSVQLALALARLFNGQHDYSFHIADQQALCSLVTFILGALIGRLGDKIGCKTRLWMTLGTFIQTLLTMAAAVTLWQSHSASVGDNRGDPAWTDTLTFATVGFISASMGLQGIMGKRLNTQFTTTVVLTTTWCELMTEPQLFQIRRLVAARDHKIMAILALFVGGFTSRALLDRVGSSGTLGIGTGLRFVITVWWLLMPAKKSKS